MVETNGSPTRPALLPVNHPLANGNVRLLLPSNPSSTLLVNGSHSSSKFSSEEVNRLSLSSRQAWQPRNLEEKIHYLYEHQRVTDLLNEYAYALDFVMVEPESVEENWTSLFTDDCEVTYPFGTYRGRKGVGKWCCDAELRFHRMMHLSSNFTISFESPSSLSSLSPSETTTTTTTTPLPPSFSHSSTSFPEIAYARTALNAVCGTDRDDIGKTFAEGGYYYWTFRRERCCARGVCDGAGTAGVWKIHRLFLDVNWTMGDGLGLNDDPSLNVG